VGFKGFGGKGVGNGCGNGKGDGGVVTKVWLWL